MKELETGYVVPGDYQHFYGDMLFLCKQHVTELHNLSYEFKMKYLKEWVLSGSCLPQLSFKGYI